MDDRATGWNDSKAPALAAHFDLLPSLFGEQSEPLYATRGVAVSSSEARRAQEEGEQATRDMGYAAVRPLRFGDGSHGR